MTHARSSILIPAAMIAAVLALGVLAPVPARAHFSYSCMVADMYCVQVSTNYRHLGCDAELCRVQAGLEVATFSTPAYADASLTWDETPSANNGVIATGCNSLGALSCINGATGVLEWRLADNCHTFVMAIEASAGIIRPVYLVRHASGESVIACANGTLTVVSG